MSVNVIYTPFMANELTLLHRKGHCFVENDILIPTLGHKRAAILPVEYHKEQLAADEMYRQLELALQAASPTLGQKNRELLAGNWQQLQKVRI